jgi:hypothetical protein
MPLPIRAASAQGNKGEIRDTTLAQPVSRHKRPLAAATRQDDTCRWRAQIVDRIDDQPPRAGEG